MIWEKFKSLFFKASKPSLSIDDCKLIEQACKNNDEATVKELFEKGEHPPDSRKIYTSIEYVCRNGNISLLEYLLTSPNTKAFHKTHLNSNVLIDAACEYGQLEVLKFLCESPKLEKHTNLQTWGIGGLRQLCNWGKEDSDWASNNFEIAKYLLKDSEVIKACACVIKNDKESFYYSANYCHSLIEKLFSTGKVETADFIINTLELKDHITVNHAEQYLKDACMNSNRATVDYLLTSPNFNHILDIHSCNDAVFNTFAYNRDYKMLEHLIFNFNYNKSIDASKFLNEYVNDDVIEKIDNMFKVRDLNQKLEAELKSDKPVQKKLKI